MGVLNEPLYEDAMGDVWNGFHEKVILGCWRSSDQF